MLGRVHSIETLGLHEGPGIRFTAFMQGCPLRCVYCHNPDTWSPAGGAEMTAEALLRQALRYRPYFERSGGVTCTGGEPLLQPEFLTAFFQLSKAAGLHTALDTSGAGIGGYEALLESTDLVLLDLKGADAEDFHRTTGASYDRVKPFHDALRASRARIWIRHVVVPGLSDAPAHLDRIRQLAATFPRVDRVELLPYHTLGIDKYQKMGIEYPLRDTAILLEPKTVTNISAGDLV